MRDEFQKKTVIFQEVALKNDRYFNSSKIN